MMSAEKQTVLVLDATYLSALAIVRALGHRGVRVVLAGIDPKPVAKYSKHVAAYATYPDPAVDRKGFLNSVEALVERYRPDLLIPVTEKTLIPLADNRARLEASVPLAIAPDQALESVLDKDRTFTLAQSLGIPTPKSVLIEDQQQLEASVGQVQFPLVIKPARSIATKEGSSGLQLSVSYAFTPTELLDLASALLPHGPVLLQSYFKGEGVGLEVLADRGEIRYAFQHRRCHELPLSGGGSSLRESVSISPDLLRAATQLITALTWHGVAMVEFKRNVQDGSFCLMEINGRFWGSLPLSVAAGADFPWMVWHLHRDMPVPVIQPARTEIQCRDLRKDIYWHELVLRRAADARLFKFPTGRRLLFDLTGMLSLKHYQDAWRWNDPLPGLFEFGRIVKDYAIRLSGLLQERWLFQRQANCWRKGRIQKQLNNASNVLVLCYGNINRSALAHAFVEQCCQSQSKTIVSAGFHSEEGRPADPQMVKTAKQHGIDLSAWHSNGVTQSMLLNADIIFVMELAHRQRVLKLMPEAVNRCYLWGCSFIEEGGDLEISDPYGKSPEMYQQCCERIIWSGTKMFSKR